MVAGGTGVNPTHIERRPQRERRALSRSAVRAILQELAGVMRARLIAGVTACLLTAQLAALPCGAACHPLAHQHSASDGQPAEHSCHEQSATEDVRQIAAAPLGCTHDHQSGESAVSPGPGPRDDYRAAAPATPAANHVPRVPPMSLAIATPRHSADLIAPTVRLSSPLRI